MAKMGLLVGDVIWIYEEYEIPSDATKLGVARALVKFDMNLRAILKAQKLLTRDSRSVERKKPGLKKARRAPQWSKR